jgi:hypothetical protein
VTGSSVEFIYITLSSLMLLNWNRCLVPSTPKHQSSLKLAKVLADRTAVAQHSSYRRSGSLRARQPLYGLRRLSLLLVTIGLTHFLGQRRFMVRRLSLNRIVPAARLLLRCMAKYCKLLVQNYWWWTTACSKHVADKFSEINY